MVTDTSAHTQRRRYTPPQTTTHHLHADGPACLAATNADNHSEGRHTIALRGASDVVISGAPGLPFTLTESGGDGIYVAHDMRVKPPAPVHNSRNVTVDWVRSTRNYRQGA